MFPLAKFRQTYAMMPELEECISDQLGDAINARLMQQYCSEVKWQYVQPLTTNHGSGTLLVHRLQQQCATLTKLLQTSVVVVRSFYCTSEMFSSESVCILRRSLAMSCKSCTTQLYRVMEMLGIQLVLRSEETQVNDV